MNEFKINETYSSMKNYCKILYKELSTMKAKNDSLNQKVKELESNISSILQCTVTKEEMREIIKEGISPIIKILNEKELTSNQKQIDNVLEKQLKEKIKKIEETMQNTKRIEEIIQSEDLNSTVSSLIETEDKRIASGGDDGNISISSYNIYEKTWNRDIHKKKAHVKGVNSLCTLNGNRLLSGGDDNSIKVWSLSDVELTLIKEIQEHNQKVYKVIPLSNYRFASCSGDHTIKIWRDDNTYKCISTLQHYATVNSILQLKGKEVLVSADQGFGMFELYDGYGPRPEPPCVFFWNLNTYKYNYQQRLEGFKIFRPTQMIELSDRNIALSNIYEPYPIVIINSSSYQVQKKIKLEGFVSNYSSLCVCNEHSFIYVYKGTFLQISSENGSILYHSTGGKFDGYIGGIIPIEGGKYYAIQYDKKITIVKFYNP